MLAGETLNERSGERRDGRVLDVFGILVHLMCGLLLISAREHQVGDADIAVDVQIQRFYVVAAALRREARHLALAVLRVLIPGAHMTLALVAGGQHGAPLVIENLLDGGAAAVDVLGVVVVAGPLRIG